MTWLAPAAWLGLIALAIPVLVHLLSRHRARAQQFPTLRFLDVAAVTPTRRTRLNDVLLLLVRLGVLAAAVAALAQPRFFNRNVARDTRGDITRAIVVDTSASMRRLTPAGERAVDVARRDAQRLVREARGGVVLETSTPSRAIPGATEWLGAQPGTREMIVMSDFQSGTLDQHDVAAVPGDVGVRLQRLDIAPQTAPLDAGVRSDDGFSNAVFLLAGPAERVRADAAKRAALYVGVPLLTSGDSGAVIVFPESERRAAIAASAIALSEPWMADAVARMRHDATLVRAAATAVVVSRDDAAFTPPRFVVVARTDSGRPVVVATRGTLDGRARLVFFALAGAGSLSSAALFGATARALSTATPAAELDPAHVTDVDLRAWEHAPSGGVASHTPTGDDASDGRWLWILALVLLGAEALMRPRTAAHRAAELADERLA